MSTPTTASPASTSTTTTTTSTTARSPITTIVPTTEVYVEPDPIPGYASIDPENPAAVNVHIGMECPNFDHWYAAVEGWVFEIDLVVPDDLTYDSVIQQGRWANQDGATVTLLLPGGYVTGDATHDFADAGDGWEHVIVDRGEGILAAGSRPLTDEAAEFAPRCATVLESEGLTVDELAEFNNTLEFQGDA